MDFSSKENTNGQQVFKQINIINQRATNQNHNGISAHLNQNDHHKKYCRYTCRETETFKHGWLQGKLVQLLWKIIGNCQEKIQIELLSTGLKEMM